MVLGGLVWYQGTVGWQVLESNEVEGMHDLLHLVKGEAPVEEDKDEGTAAGLCFIHQTGKAVTRGVERGQQEDSEARGDSTAQYAHQRWLHS